MRRVFCLFINDDLFYFTFMSIFQNYISMLYDLIKYICWFSFYLYLFLVLEVVLNVAGSIDLSTSSDQFLEVVGICNFSLSFRIIVVCISLAVTCWK